MTKRLVSGMNIFCLVGVSVSDTIRSIDNSNAILYNERTKLCDIMSGTLPILVQLGHGSRSTDSETTIFCTIIGESFGRFGAESFAGLLLLSVPPIQRKYSNKNSFGRGSFLDRIFDRHTLSWLPRSPK